MLGRIIPRSHPRARAMRCDVLLPRTVFQPRLEGPLGGLILVPLGGLIRSVTNLALLLLTSLLTTYANGIGDEIAGVGKDLPLPRFRAMIGELGLLRNTRVAC
jgi:hypothetical protein